LFLCVVMNNIPGTETWSDEAPGGKSVTTDLKKASRQIGEHTLTLIDSPGLDCSSKMQGSYYIPPSRHQS